MNDYGFIHRYPSTNFHELNLDWILAQMIELRSNMRNFVSQNTIKYADPILWNITTQYESNTVVVDAGGNAYLSTQPVPAGINITNEDYWTTIGNFSLLFASVKESIAAADEGTSTYASKNRAVGDLVWLNNILYEVTKPITTGQSYVIGTNVTEVTIEEKLGDIKEIIKDLPTLPVFNVADYGMLPDTNIYDQLFDFLWDEIYPRGGGIVFFPKGKYTIDYTIFIPDNTTFIGEGDDTEIYFDLTDPYVGAALENGGSNIVIRDMAVTIATNANYNTVGSLPNCVGVSDFDFSRMPEKRSHDLARKSGNHNIKIINVNCPNSNYGIQVEPLTNKVSDVYIINHSCPSGMFSIYPLTDDLILENIYASNITCDTLRIGIGWRGLRGCQINNIDCTQMLIKSWNVNISNFHIHSSRGNRTSTSSGYQSAIVVSASNVNFSNGTITRDSTSLQTRILQVISDSDFVPEVSFDSVYIDPSALTAFTLTNAVARSSIYHSNCNWNPYAPYNNSMSDYAGNMGSAAPLIVKYNATEGRSYATGCCIFNQTGGDTIIGKINGYLQLTNVVKAGSGVAFLFAWNDRTKGVEPATIYLDPSDKAFHIKTMMNPNVSGFNACYFNISW